MKWLIDLINIIFKKQEPEMPKAPTPSKELTLIQNAYLIAKKEIGVKEVEGSEDNQRILEYHQATDLKASDDETAWCSAFMNWCVQKSGGGGTKDAMARSWLKWGKTIDEPQESDVVIFSAPLRGPQAGHVAFYVGPGTAGFINVLGGNQSNAVRYSMYPKALILGYRRSLDG